MRALAAALLLPLVAVALAGCGGAPGDAAPEPVPEPSPDTGPAPSPTPTDGSGGDGEEALPEILVVLEQRIEEAVPGGSGEAAFVVPDGGYLELFVATPGDVAIKGGLRLVLVGPSGEDHVLEDGLFVHDDGGITLPGLGCEPCQWRATASPGDWRLEWDVEGEAAFDVRVQAQ